MSTTDSSDESDTEENNLEPKNDVIIFKFVCKYLFKKALILIFYFRLSFIQRVPVTNLHATNLEQKKGFQK